MAVLDLGGGGFGGGGRRPRRNPVYQAATPGIAVPKGTVTTPGYQPSAPAPAPPAPAPPTPESKKFTGLNQGAILNFLAGFPNSSQGLRDAFPGMLAAGLLPEGSYVENKATADEIFVPGYGWIDFLPNADSGNPGPWHWSYNPNPQNFFDDPIGMFFGGQVNDVLEQLKQPRPLSPELTEAFNILKGFSTSSGGVGGADLNALRAATQQRATELRADPFTDTEEAAMRVGAFDNLERSRQVAIQQVRERMAAQGHAPTSPTVEAAIQQVMQRFDALRAQNENQLLTGSIDERQRRRSEALTIQQQLAELEQSNAGLDLTARGQSIGASGALAALAQFMDTQRDPMERLMAILYASGLIPNYAQQQYENASGEVS